MLRRDIYYNCCKREEIDVDNLYVLNDVGFQ